MGHRLPARCTAMSPLAFRLPYYRHAEVQLKDYTSLALIGAALVTCSLTKLFLNQANFRESVQFVFCAVFTSCMKALVIDFCFFLRTFLSTLTVCYMLRLRKPSQGVTTVAEALGCGLGRMVNNRLIVPQVRQAKTVYRVDDFSRCSLDGELNALVELHYARNWL